MATKIKWEDADFAWNDNTYKWDDVAIIEEITKADGGLDHEALEQLEEKKKKRLIHLVMRRNGIKIYDESKVVKNIKVHVDDIEMVIKEVKAQIQAENIHV